MKQLTIRGMSPELERRLRAEARRRHTSLNRAAVALMGKGAGLTEDEGTDRVGNSLDQFIASWTESEAEQVNASIAELDTIDESFWQ